MILAARADEQDLLRMRALVDFMVTLHRGDVLIFIGGDTQELGSFIGVCQERWPTYCGGICRI